MVTVGNRPQGHYFGKMSGAGFKVVYKPTEILQRLVHATAQTDTMPVLALREGVLEVTEKVS